MNDGRCRQPMGVSVYLSLLPLRNRESQLLLWVVAPVPAGAGASVDHAHCAGFYADGGCEISRRRGLAEIVFVRAPAGDGAVGSHPAGVVGSSADGGELPLRRRGLADGAQYNLKPVVTAPAFNGTVAPHAAAVRGPGADGGKLPGRRRGLAYVVISPAFNGAIPSYPAGARAPGADREELDLRPPAISAEARDDTAGIPGGFGFGGGPARRGLR